MATVVKSWTFDSDNEGLADAGQSGEVTFAWDGTEGTPAAGSLKCAMGVPYEEQETARKSSTADTWETWGVPAGATVTGVQCSLYTKRLQTGSQYWTIALRLIAASGAIIATVAQTPAATPTTWTQVNGTAQAVGATYQTSATPVRLMLDFNWGTASNDACWLDAIDLTITYTPGGGGGGGAQIPAAVAQELHARGHANLRR